MSKGEICALLPIVDTGKSWVSLPHMSYGGILANEEMGNHSFKNIIDNIIHTLKQNNGESGFYLCDLEDIINENKNLSVNIFIRTMFDNHGENFHKSEKVTSILNLPKTDKLLLSKINSNLKRKISKAQKSGINIQYGGEELIDDFYVVYCRNIYALNSLNYSKQTIKDLFTTYKFGELKIFIAYKNNIAIGASLMASYNGYYENMFFATISDARKYYVSDLLHYEMIRYSIKSNLTENNKKAGVYSFGRSTINSGVHKYKSHWPVDDYPLFNYSNSPDIRKHRWLTKFWGLLPYVISKPLGSKLIKHIY